MVDASVNEELSLIRPKRGGVAIDILVPVYLDHFQEGQLSLRNSSIRARRPGHCKSLVNIVFIRIRPFTRPEDRF